MFNSWWFKNEYALDVSLIKTSFIKLPKTIGLCNFNREGERAKGNKSKLIQSERGVEEESEG